MLQRSD